MISFTSASRTANAPLLIMVPAGAVVMDEAWQVAQPTLVNSVSPALASAVFARAESHGGL
jgi:hypothetical protein